MRRPFPPRIGLAGALGLALALLSSGPGAAGAQEVLVRAYLGQSTVGVGRPFVLNVEVNGSQNLDREPELPDLSAFATYLGSGTSTSMQIVNGRTTVSVTLQLRYQALEEGTFEIPPIQVTVNGEVYETEIVPLTVTDAPPAAQGQPRNEPGAPEISSEDLFLTAEASRTRVREGEPLVVEYRIFTRVDVSGYSFTRIPEPQGFWVEELPLPDSPQVEQVVRDGVQYATAVIRRVALIPTGPGERRLEPLGLEAQVRVRRRTMDPFESFFDRPSLFGTVVPAAVLSNPVTLEVEALPPGRPEPFSGVVGSLTLSAILDQDSVDANEAVTFSVTARGRGNLRAIPDPTLDLPGDFEVYPPEVSEQVAPTGSGLGGTKTWQYVLIPRAPGNRTIPSVSLGYFDTSTDAYAVAVTDPLPLEVSGELPQGPATMMRGGVATLREDIRFIHLNPGSLRPAGASPLRGPLFWTLLLLPVAAVVGSVALRAHWDRLEQDPAYARRRKAGRVAHARLAQARRMVGDDRQRAFYTEAARALRGFVADKLNVPEAGMQMKDATDELRRRGVSDAVIQGVTDCLAHCDRLWFAPPGEDTGEEKRFLERMEEVMTALNREVGR
ncbi:MAG: BatD family protein [Longimicrobiales bacterium]